MSILSDKEIRGLCTPPVSVVSQANRIFYSHLTKEEVDALNLKNIGFTDILEAHNSGHVPDSILQGHWIEQRDLTEQELSGWKPMISPFTSGQVRTREEEKIISYGTSSYGYDLRCGHKFKIFTNVNSVVADPKDLNQQSFVDVEVENDGDYIIVPPNSFALTYSLERICIPRDVTGVVLGKSTYARIGLVCIATPLESSWEGYVTLEFANTTPLPMKLYAGEGCCQVLFLQGNQPCEVSYADRQGKYMDQPAEVVLPTV